MLIIFSISIYSCISHFDLTDLKIEKTYNYYSDSSYIRDVRYIITKDDFLYLGDFNRKEIIGVTDSFDQNLSIVVDNDFNGFNVKDSMIFVHSMLGKIDVFDKNNNLVSSFYLPEGEYYEGNTFAIKDSTLIFSCTKGSTNILKIKDENNIYFGDSFPFKNKTQFKLRNKNLLLEDNDKLFVISNNLPIIRIYDFEKGVLINEIDYGDHPFIRKIYSEINKNELQENQYYVVVNDAFLYLGKIYLLISTWQTEYLCNKLIEFNVEDNQIERILQLPSKYYTSFAIINNYIFAFNNEKNCIEKLFL